MYKVLIEKSAEKILEKIDEPYFSKIEIAISNLANNPRPHGYKKLKGENAYRIRIAHFRIIYLIFDGKLIIQIVKIGHRKDIYN